MSKTVAITYMRANPVTTGHEKVYNRLLSIKDAEHYVMLSATHDKDKNPLSPSDKLRFAKIVFKGAKVEIVGGGFIKAIEKVSPANKLVIVVGDDRIDNIRTLAIKYNHIYYDFDQIDVISSGTRAGNAISATKMRKWASQNDFESFASGCSKKMTDEQKREMFDLTRAGMGETDHNTINECVLFDFD